MEHKPIKLITLNAWGGRALYPLMNFLKQHASQTDIFCLQDVFDSIQNIQDERHPEEHVRGDVFRVIKSKLTDFEAYFARFEDDPHRMSSAMFVRKTLSVSGVGDRIIYKPDIPQERGSVIISARKLQYLSIQTGKKTCTIVNFHGLWDAGPKTDTPARIKQSEDIKEFLDSISGPKILCGDFNLLPDTKSMHILEKNMHNLVTERMVPSTRTQFYRHFHNPAEPNFADYVLVSPDVRVQHFEVLPDLVSDHSPLLLEFSTI